MIKRKITSKVTIWIKLNKKYFSNFNCKIFNKLIFIASSSDIIMMHWIGVDNIDGLSLTQCQVCTYVNWSYDSNAMLFYNISDPWSKDFRPLILSSDDGPIFDNSLVTNVTAQFGGTAHLPCKVHNIKYADNPVSTNRIFC